MYERGDDENCQSDWERLLEKFYPDDEFIDANRYEINDDSEEKETLTREGIVTRHQLKAFTLYLEGKPAQTSSW